ncbi:pseudouridine synthase [Planctomyces sp. SH-PL62]|uniref:pseudouridine synthase n=1 Tax=Planctomyces sp. SH-PL62 TaxID=1636152 RepID=UPI00078BFB24|nr:pseudouridine synthase [Planctomyces sp. SH-PL62]AMV40423.1 Ribosomal large subunit pseudouridine synthase B [Planctomyces sp. SH-PL62]
MAERRSFQGGGKGRPARKEGGGPKPPGGPQRSLSGSGPRRFNKGAKPFRPGQPQGSQSNYGDRRPPRPGGPGQGPGSNYGDRKPSRGPAGGAPRQPRRFEAQGGPENEKGDRLQKVLAQSGLGSRRACEEYILQGRVTVDGKTVKELGARVHPGSSVIAVDGERLKAERHVYFAVNKPKGYVSTNEDPAGRPRVVDLLSEIPERVYTVGRLDEDSTGLMILTNDGQLANRLAHPRFGVEKVYRAVVAGSPGPDILARLTEGVWLSEGKVRAKRSRIVGSQGEATILELVLAEGKKREIRRMLAKFGHKVMILTRIAIGPITLKGISVGEHRQLTRTEVDMLRKVAAGVAISPTRFLPDNARPPGKGPRPNQGYGQNRPNQGYGQGRPNQGYGQGRPNQGYGQNRPNQGYGQGRPAAGPRAAEGRGPGHEIDIEALGPPPSQRRARPEGRPNDDRQNQPVRSPSGVVPPRSHYSEGPQGGPPSRPSGRGRPGAPGGRPQGYRPEGPSSRPQGYRPEGGPSRPQGGYRAEGGPPRPQGGYRAEGGPPSRPQGGYRAEGGPPSQRPPRPEGGGRPEGPGPRPPGGPGRVPRPAGPPPSQRRSTEQGPPPGPAPKGRRVIGLDAKIYRETTEAVNEGQAPKRPMPKRRPLRKAMGIKRKRPGGKA